MKVTSAVENKEKYQVELTIEVSKEEFEAGLDRAYKKARGGISIPGFRKGKAPRKVIEGMYGESVFYEDAVEDIYPQAVEDAIKEQGIVRVAPPEVEMLSLDKNGFSFKAIVTVAPEVTIVNYKGMEAEKVLPTVSEEAIDGELGRYVGRATQMEPVERAAAMGDITNIDYVGLKDNKPFDGGTAKNYDLELGSNSFIPGFEEGIVGMSVGDIKDIPLTFPEAYHSEDLAGKDVIFQVKVNEVKEKKVPELDDEFAKDVSEFDTLAEFREDIKLKLIDREMAQSDAHFRQALLDQLTEQVTIELPEAMVNAKTETLLQNYARSLEQQGISLDAYMKYMGMDGDKIKEELTTAAVAQIKQQLALDGVVRAENIVVTDEDVEAEIQKVVATYNIPYDRAVEGLDRVSLKGDIARERALDLVSAEAKPKMVEGSTAPEIKEVTKEDVAEETQE